MEVRLILEVVDLFNEFVFNLVGDVELLETLTHLEFEVVVGLLNLGDVHFLELNFSQKLGAE